MEIKKQQILIILLSIQTRQPLTSNTPYFLVEILDCGKIIT